MSTECPKCGHRRGASDIAPESECPRCGVIYDKYLEQQARLAREWDQATAGRPSVEAEQFFEAPSRAFPWRLAGLIVAVLLVVAAVALSSRGRGAGDQARVGARFAYDMRGEWIGTADLPIELRARESYPAAYDVRLTIGDDYRVAEMEWTSGHSLLEHTTVRWTAPASIEVVERRREGMSELFADPPRGSYSLARLIDHELHVEAYRPRAVDLERIELDLSLTAAQLGAPWPGGSFAARSEDDGIEATVGGGLPKLGRVEVDREDVSFDFAPGAAAVVMRPYLQGRKPWPNGLPADLSEPIDGLALNELDLPGFLPLFVSIDPVRAHLGRGQLAFGPPPEDDVVELGPESRISLDFRLAMSWSAQVVFYPDGHAIVWLPDRALEIPLERVEVEETAEAAPAGD